MGSELCWDGSLVKRKWKNMENGRFCRRLWLDWESTAWAAMPRLGSIGLKNASTFRSKNPLFL